MTTSLLHSFITNNIPRTLFPRQGLRFLNGLNFRPLRKSRIVHPAFTRTADEFRSRDENELKRTIGFVDRGWFSLRRHFCFTSPIMSALNRLHFDNLALRSLPIDEETEIFSREVRGACFSHVKPTPVENPQMVAQALPALQLLDLGEEDVKDKDFAEFFSGNKIFEGSETAAHCYCGHQFGHFAGQLGDGAAV
jgi:hypothetical protein